MSSIIYKPIHALYLKHRFIIQQYNKIIEYTKESYFTAFLCDYSQDKTYKFKVFQWKSGTWKIKENMSIRHAELQKKHKDKIRNGISK